MGGEVGGVVGDVDPVVVGPVDVGLVLVVPELLVGDDGVVGLEVCGVEGVGVVEFDAGEVCPPTGTGFGRTTM